MLEPKVTRQPDGGVVISAGETLRVHLSASATAQDLAEVVRLARELAGLHANLRAAEDAASLGLVTAIVAHDVHNALVPVLVAADALAARGDANTAEAARLLAAGCWRIAGMLRRLSSLGQRSRPTRVDVNAVVSELMPTLHAIVRDRAHLTTQLETPLPAVVIDPVDLERTLLNLVANARDASTHDGTILVATSALDGWVLVEVADQGSGMDEDTRARAGEPFFTTKAPGLGSGLGLASVARFAHAAGGRTEIESHPGQGTRVRVLLPADPARATP